MKKGKEIKRGDRFGLLTVLCPAQPIKDKSGSNKRTFLCSCDCGCADLVVRGDALLRGRKSCGCLLKKHSTRIINGYKAIYKPNHVAAMHNKKHEGYVYEHIYLMVEKVGRALHSDEVVHHKDFNKRNNALNNLILMTRAEHGKLHAAHRLRLEGKCIRNDKCIDCGKTLPYRTKTQRCIRCSRIASRKVKRPPKEELLRMLKEMSKEAIGRKYGVTGKSVAKWIKSYNGQAI